VSCLFAVCQYFGVWPAQEKIEGLRRITHLHFEHAYEEPRGIPGRFYGVGLVFHRLKFAHVGALLTVFVAYGAFRAKGVWSWLGFVLVALSIVTITQFALVRSASASLVVVLALVWALLQQRPGRAFLLGSLGAVMVMGLLALQPQVRMRFAASIDPKSHGDRPELWAAGWRAWKTSPVVGIGYDQFHPGKFPSDEMPDHIQKHGGKAHNQFLTIAAEAGVPGALLFIAMLLWFARRLLRNRVAGAAGLGALAFFVLLSALHDPLFHAQFSMGFVLALGVSLAMVERGDETTEGAAS
jgi:O-antigen ligase